MVTQYGMTDVLGAAVFETRARGTFLSDAGIPLPREFSEETARQIDAQLQQLLTQAEARVRETIVASRAALNELAQLLLTQETVERQSLTKILRDSKRSRTVPSTTDAVATA